MKSPLPPSRPGWIASPLFVIARTKFSADATALLGHIATHQPAALVLGLPITVLLNPEGLEIARLRGDADWDSDSARAIIAAITGGS